MSARVLFERSKCSGANIQSRCSRIGYSHDNHRPGQCKAVRDFYSAPVGERPRAEYNCDGHVFCVCVSVCLSVRLSVSISPEQQVQSSPHFVHVTRGRGSVLLWRRCDTLCTSGFVDDVIFAHNGQE